MQVAACPYLAGMSPIPENNKVAKGGSFKTDIGGHMRIQYHYEWGPSTQAVLGAYAGIGEISFRAVRTVTGTTGLCRALDVTDRRFLGTRIAPIHGGLGFTISVSGGTFDPSGRRIAPAFLMVPP